jgi:hypothetical protein
MPRAFAPLARLLIVTLVAAWLSGASEGLSAAPDSVEGVPVVLSDAGGEAQTYVAPPIAIAGAAPTSLFEVEYENFPPEAEAAVQYAVEIWQSLLVSPVPIRVSASWEPMEEGQLGAARATRFLRNFAGATRPDTLYPAALADALAGDDLRPGEADIIITINSDNDDWYFGSGATPRRQSNLTSVVLHEIGHGLGFSGTATLINQQGTWASSTPRVYDLFVTTGAGAYLRDADLFPTRSEALTEQLQGGDLYFDGQHAKAANGDIPPLLYAPDPWEQGSSFGHLDEDAYPAGDPNALMTPYLARGEAAYQPGPVALGILADLGWPIAGGSSGTPPARAAQLLPGMLDLGAVTVGTSAAPQTVTLTNAGTIPLTLARGSGFGPSGTGFITTRETCTAAPIAPGGRCTLTITFAPLKAGAATLAWEPKVASGESLATLTLRATGVAGATTGDGLVDDPRCIARAGHCQRVRATPASGR